MRKIITVIIMAMFSTIAFADEHTKFWSAQAPIICGKTIDVHEFIAEEGMTPLTISFGKVGAKSDGEIAFIITLWIKQDTTEQITTMQTTDGSETCILYKSFDTIINPNFDGGSDL